MLFVKGCDSPMILFFIILLSFIICILLISLTGPIYGSIIIISILMGCIFRGLYLLTKIYQAIVPKEDRGKEALEHYLAEREKREQLEQSATEN